MEKTGVAKAGVSVCVLVKNGPDRRPGSEVVPLWRHRCTGDVCRFLHDCIVNGDVVELFKAGPVDAGKIEIAMTRFHDSGNALIERRLMGLECLDHCLRRIKENAGVPGITAIGQEGLGPVKVWFFDELFNRAYRGVTWCDLDIAVTGVWLARGDAERDD